jgi:hypothetical protein
MVCLKQNNIEVQLPSNCEIGDTASKHNSLHETIMLGLSPFHITVYLFGTVIDEHLEWDAWIMLGFFLHARPGSIRIETCLE